MGVGKYDIKEPEFDRSRSDQYELSILLGVGSFTYIIRESRDFRIMAFRSLGMETDLTQWSAAMQRIVLEDEVLRPGLIRKVYVGWISERATLLPIRLFQEGRESDYLGQLTTIGLEDRCFSDALPSLGTQLIYAIGSDRLDSVERRFAPLRKHHFAAGLLKNWQQQSREIGQRAVYCCLRDGHLVAAAIDAGKLVFFNLYTFKSAQDALYFTSLVYQQCGWALSRVPLYLCGEIIRQSEVYKQLYRFVEDIRFLEHDGSQGRAGNLLAQLPSHLYYDLLCQF